MTPNELLGQLNGVERKFAPQKLIREPGGRRFWVNVPAFPLSVAASQQSGYSASTETRTTHCGAPWHCHQRLGCWNRHSGPHGAIEAKGWTVAVIGTPLSKSYPRENADLQALIQREHLCISQFPEGYPTTPGNFPIRNRTMALISDAMVIEAGETSGTINQGWEALRLGRGVFLSKSLSENKSLTWPREMHQLWSWSVVRRHA